MINYDGRFLLIYLAIKYQGNYDKIMAALHLSEDPPFEEAMATFKSLKCKVLTILDYDYPEKLKQIPHPPIVLFYYGDISLLNKYCIGTVGSRKVNAYGKYSTEMILKGLAPGRVVVSGMARGIDTIAHTCAIKNGGRTIAVLGSGIDYAYPTSNKLLYEIIKKKHLVISEYPGMTPPEPTNFPARNRIIVGLSDFVYVPQINDYATGTMISVNLTLNMGKTLVVAPNPIYSGTLNNMLISEGALIAVDPEQIKYELKIKD